jgi:hypothetical protein
MASSINVIDVESEEALIRQEEALASETGDVIHWRCIRIVKLQVSV